MSDRPDRGGAVQPYKFWQPMTEEQPKRKPIIPRIVHFVKTMPLFAMGLVGGFSLLVYDLRRVKKRNPNYPLNIWLLDLRLRVVGVIVMSLIVTMTIDTAQKKYVRLQREKQQRLKIADVTNDDAES